VAQISVTQIAYIHDIASVNHFFYCTGAVDFNIVRVRRNYEYVQFCFIITFLGITLLYIFFFKIMELKEFREKAGSLEK